jgi:hypothetical protein
MDGFPVVTVIKVDLALVNLGARAGLLKSLAVENVRSPGAAGFADGATARPYTPTPHNRPEVTLDGEQERFPRTIEPGDVRSVEINLKLTGAFRTQEGTRYLDPEDHKRDVEKVARLLAGLEEVSFDVVCRYRRGGGFHGRTDDESTTTISIDGERFKEGAIRYWRESEQWEYLADLVASDI